MLNSDIYNFLLNYDISNYKLIKIIKSDKYHLVIEILLDGENYIIKKINKFNNFFTNKINLFIYKKLIFEVNKNIKGNYITDFLGEKYILYKKNIGDNLFTINDNLIYEGFINYIYNWHKHGIYLMKNTDISLFNIDIDLVLKKIINNSNTIKINIGEKNYNFFLKELFLLNKNIKTILSSKNNCYGVVHGNLTTKNILYYEKRYLIIDYDTISYGVIFFDVFDYLSNILIYFKNYIITNKITSIISDKYLLNINEQNVFLEYSLIKTLFDFSMENDGNYFKKNNLSIVSKIIKMIKKNYKIYEI